MTYSGDMQKDAHGTLKTCTMVAKNGGVMQTDARGMNVLAYLQLREGTSLFYNGTM